MSYWIFKVFITNRGDNEFSLWLDKLPIKARAKIVRRIRYLEITERWKRPEFDKLAGYEDLYEIRVVFGGNQYRAVGCYGPARREFTILIGAVEKNDQLEPRKALDIAVYRSKLIDQQKHTAEFVDA